MKDEIYQDLKDRYEMSKIISQIPLFVSQSGTTEDKSEMGVEEEIDKVGNYDCRLLTIYVSTVEDEEQGNEDNRSRWMEIRIRKKEGEEEIVMVTSENGYIVNGKDVDECLHNLSSFIENITEMFTGEFPDNILVWDWLGQ